MYGDATYEQTEIDGIPYCPGNGDVHRLHFFTLKEAIHPNETPFPGNADAWHCGWSWQLERLMEHWDLYDAEFGFDPDIVF